MITVADLGGEFSAESSTGFNPCVERGIPYCLRIRREGTEDHAAVLKNAGVSIALYPAKTSRFVQVRPGVGLGIEDFAQL